MQKENFAAGAPKKINNTDISFIYTVAAVVFAVVAVFYAGFNLLSDADLISYENFYYMINDFNISASGIGQNITEFKYGSGEDQQYGSYRGGLVILNSDTVTAFSAKGKRTLYKKNSIPNPKLRISDEFIAVFSQNGRAVGLYNSFSLVFSESDLETINGLSDYSVIDMELSDNGMIAIAVNTGTTECRTFLYDKKGKLCAEYKYNDYITDISLSPDGGYIAFSYIDADTSDGSVISVSEIYRIGEDAPFAKYSVNDSLCISSGFTAENRFISAFDSQVVAYDASDEKNSFISILPEAVSVAFVTVCNDGAMISYMTNDSGVKKLAAVDRTGALHDVKTDISASVYNSALKGDFVYIGGYGTDSVEIFNIRTGTTLLVDCGRDTGGANIIVTDEEQNEFILCFGSEGIKYNSKAPKVEIR